MVQILEQENFGGNLAQNLGQSASTGLQMLLQAKIKGMQEKERAKAFSNILGESSSNIQESDSEEPGFSESQLIQAEQLVPGSSKILLEKEKQKKAQFEKKKDKQRLSHILSRMNQTLPYVGPGKIGNIATEKGRTARQYYDSLGLQLEQIGATMVGKGTLSKPRFEFLLKNLPSSKKTQAANKGAIQAWSEILEVEVPGMGSIEEEIDISSSNSKSKKELTKEKAQELLNRAKGDKEKAIKLARKLGYDV